jgi:hypothetical protein
MVHSGVNSKLENLTAIVRRIKSGIASGSASSSASVEGEGTKRPKTNGGHEDEMAQISNRSLEALLQAKDDQIKAKDDQIKAKDDKMERMRQMLEGLGIKVS